MTFFARLLARESGSTVLVFLAFVVSLAERNTLLREVIATVVEVVARQVAPTVAVIGLATAAVVARSVQWLMHVGTRRASASRCLFRARVTGALAHEGHRTELVQLAVIVSLAGSASGLVVVAAIVEGVARRVAPAVTGGLATAGAGTRSVQVVAVRVRTRRTYTAESIALAVAELARAHALVVRVAVLVRLALVVALAG